MQNAPVAPLPKTEHIDARPFTLMLLASLGLIIITDLNKSAKLKIELGIW